MSSNPKHCDYNALADKAVAYASEHGLDVRKPSRRSDCSVVQHGYSFLRFGSTRVMARREGSDTPRGSYIEERAYQDPDLWEWCLGVLRLGRTVECGAGVSLREIGEFVHHRNVDHDMRYLSELVKDPEFPWDLDPDYQRGHVWTLRQRELFLGHVIENGQTPLVWVEEGAHGLGPYRVIDGKQRIMSFLMFIEGTVAAELSDGRKISYRDFDEIDRRFCPSIRVALVHFGTRAEELRFYLKLNRGGSVHTDEEIDRVRALLAEAEASEGK